MKLPESGIPVRLHKATWKDFDVHGAMALAKLWSESYPGAWLPPTAAMAYVGQGLVLHGDTGSGKTTAAAMILKDVVEHGHSAWFVPAGSLEVILHRQIEMGTFMRKAASITDEFEQEFEMISERLSKVRRSYYVVCIDDWGRERDSGSQFLQDYVENLVRERFNRGLPTLLTTNLSEDDIEARYGRPWYSFMTEAFTFIDFDNPDRRGAR